jgi:hypothetical protein
MIDFSKLSKDILEIRNQEQFSKYLESYFSEIEQYFDNLSLEEIDKLKFDIEDLLYDLEDNKLIQEQNTNLINAFLILLAQKFEQANLIGAITLIFNYLPNSSVKKRLEASKIYLRTNDISRDYHNNFEKILDLISNSIVEDEGNYKAINAVANFYIVASSQFSRLKDESLLQSFRNLFFQNENKYPLLKNELIKNIVSSLTTTNFNVEIENIKKQINDNKPNFKSCDLLKNEIRIENSDYSKELYSLENPTFEKIKKVSDLHVKNLVNQDELFERLNRGIKIIDDENLLFKYIQSFGNKHKIKLYDAFEKIIAKFNGEKINIIDWGCGQAFATTMLIEYIKEKNINLHINDICLIEPSKLALSRGLLHIDILKTDNYNIKAINCDIDCLKKEDLVINNSYKTLHLFSNILDVESFNLNTDFLQKISSNFKNDNTFICVSPNINDKRNSRIDLFYKYFDENFDTEIISFRSDDIEKHKRYEKIFEVKYIYEIPTKEKYNEIEVRKNDYSLDIISELSIYSNYVVPILNLKILENSINIDPEYAIFKIRKVAEVITSKIYSKYEDNEQVISFNDKIRYLAYEQKIYTKAITNYVQTLRTIGNRGVHGNETDISKLRLDAHMMVIALICFIKEIKDNELI